MKILYVVAFEQCVHFVAGKLPYRRSDACKCGLSSEIAYSGYTSIRYCHVVPLHRPTTYTRRSRFALRLKLLKDFFVNVPHPSGKCSLTLCVMCA